MIKLENLIGSLRATYGRFTVFIITAMAGCTLTMLVGEKLLDYNFHQSNVRWIVYIMLIVSLIVAYQIQKITDRRYPH